MDQIYPGRFTFDMVYFIFMEILFANLVSGIMIDGFGSLKEADAEKDQDKQNFCYICALEKQEVLIMVFRCKKWEQPSKNIPRSISSGIISSIVTVSN